MTKKKQSEDKEEIMRVLVCGRDEEGPWSELHKFKKVYTKGLPRCYYEWEPIEEEQPR